MSYLTLAKGIPDFSQAVISFWFRVPKDSIDAAVAAAESDTPYLDHCIPLLTFGQPQQEKILQAKEELLCGFVDGVGPTVSAVVGFNEIDVVPTAPCHIVVDCSDGVEQAGKITGVLAFNIQMGNTAAGTNFYVDAATASAQSVWIVPGDPASGANPDVQQWADLANSKGSGVVAKTESHPEVNPENPILPYRYYIFYTGLKDLTSDYIARVPESFYVKTLPRIEPDKWHHLLLSFDVGSPVVAAAPNPESDKSLTKWLNVSEGVSAYSKLWYALDDVDYRGRGDDDDSGNHTYHMGPYSVDYDIQQSGGTVPGGKAGDPNGILTKNGWDTAEQGSSPFLFNLPLAPQSYDYTPVPIPTDSNTGPAAVGIPASVEHESHILRVEMAEFQLFTAVTLDTAIVKNRRAFIGGDGKPVAPTKKITATDPTSGSIELLGKRPEILLHTSANWKNGKNTGSIGLSDDGDAIPAGQFEPTGGIASYKPDPILD